MPATICTGIKKLNKSYTLLKCILVYWHYRNLASDFVCSYLLHLCSYQPHLYS